jgi:hypothetical protein
MVCRLRPAQRLQGDLMPVEGFPAAPVVPKAARLDAGFSEFLPPYETVRIRTDSLVVSANHL